MTTGFGAVSTGIHRTPATAVVLGLIDEQVTTSSVVLAYAHFRGFVGGEQISRSAGDGPKDEIGTIDLRSPFPVNLTTRGG